MRRRIQVGIPRCRTGSSPTHAGALRRRSWWSVADRPGCCIREPVLLGRRVSRDSGALSKKILVAPINFLQCRNRSPSAVHGLGLRQWLSEQRRNRGAGKHPNGPPKGI
jgi:hypothetical protein